MKDLKINRDMDQPSDEDLLKYQNFDEVLKKANQDTSSNSTKTVSKSWWYFTVGLFIVFGVVVLVINSYVTITNETKKTYVVDSQESALIEKQELPNFNVLNNDASSENSTEVAVTSLDNDTQEKPKKPINDPVSINYFYPKEASTLTFNLDEKFGLRSQYQDFEEFSIYDNLAFQPIGNYQQGWLKASWTAVELVKKEGNYFLMLTKNGTTLPCQVVPVFESDDLVQALETYAANLE
jgi:hypothetical protein